MDRRTDSHETTLYTALAAYGKNLKMLSQFDVDQIASEEDGQE